MRTKTRRDKVDTVAVKGESFFLSMERVNSAAISKAKAAFFNLVCHDFPVKHSNFLFYKDQKVLF